MTRLVNGSSPSTDPPCLHPPPSSSPPSVDLDVFHVTTVTEDVAAITVVELHMMDKRKYFPLTVVSGFTIRTALYPFNLIKTRLQLQRRQNVMYTSLFDAFRKTIASEGFFGLYRGFWVSNLMAISQVTYISTYEAVRHLLSQAGPASSLSDNRLRSFIAGGCASMVGQTTVVPIDIISQHLQMLGMNRSDTVHAAADPARTITNTMAEASKSSPAVTTATVHPRVRPTRSEPLDLASSEIIGSKGGAMRLQFQTTRAIIVAIHRRDGIMGFYRGYFTSLATYAPSSALWWCFYSVYCDAVSDVAPAWVPRLVLQCFAAQLGGVTTCLLITPMDAIRARVQVENTRFVETARSLWEEEKMGIFVKGLSARLVQSLTFSFFIILGYETIKRWSLLDEYKHRVRW